jgi:hypothetical protein
MPPHPLLSSLGEERGMDYGAGVKVRFAGFPSVPLCDLGDSAFSSVGVRLHGYSLARLCLPV